MSTNPLPVFTTQVFMHSLDENCHGKPAISHCFCDGHRLDLSVAAEHPYEIAQCAASITLDFDGFCLRLRDRDISLERFIDARFPLFFTWHQGALVIGNHIHQIRRYTGQSDWDAAYFAYYLGQEEAQTRETPFKGIGKVLNGERLAIDRQTGEMRSCMAGAQAALFPPSHPRPDLEQVLRASVSQVAAAQDCLLEFSGGLDSTALMLCARTGQRKLRALTAWDSQASAPEDHWHACRLAERYALDHALIDLSTLSGMELQSGVHAHHPSQMFMGFGYEKRLLSSGHDMKGAIYLNGHGGDHLFLANPPIECALTPLLAGDFSRGLQILKKLAGFYCLPYGLVIGKLLQAMMRYRIHRDSTQPYWKTAKGYSAADWMSPEVRRQAQQVQSYKKLMGFPVLTPDAQIRVALFYQLAQELSHVRLRDQQARLDFPFFRSTVIRAASAFAMSRSFDRNHSRKMFRAAFYARHAESALWRQSKGHTTAMALRALSRQRAAIHDLLRHGYLVNAGMVHWPGLERELKKMHYGIGGVSPGFMHALAIEVFVRHTMECDT